MASSGDMLGKFSRERAPRLISYSFSPFREQTAGVAKVIPYRKSPVKDEHSLRSHVRCSLPAVRSESLGLFRFLLCGIFGLIRLLLCSLMVGSTCRSTS